MFKRLEGAVMIINTFLPLIAILVISALGWAFVHTVREAAREPLAKIEGSIRRMEATIGSAKAAAGDLSDAVIEGVGRPIKSAADAVGAIPVSIRVDLPPLRIPMLTCRSSRTWRWKAGRVFLPWMCGSGCPMSMSECPRYRRSSCRRFGFPDCRGSRRRSPIFSTSSRALSMC